MPSLVEDKGEFEQTDAGNFFKFVVGRTHLKELDGRAEPGFWKVGGE